MKKVSMLLMCLFAMMTAASLSAKAQEITITLRPGWNWIGYPNAMSMELNDAFGDFIPMEGDVVKSEFAFAEYSNGNWAGSLTHFIPGKGYMYCSMRTEETSFVFRTSQSHVLVNTAEPLLITTASSMCGGEVTTTDGTYILMKGLCWAAHENPMTNNDFYQEAGSGEGSFTISMTGLNIGTTYYVRAYAVTLYGTVYGNEVSFTTEAGGSGGDHGYVDLGLPSGTLWATCNVGAEIPEDYGDYFAWGETQPKDTYNWSNYIYGSDLDQLTKYCNDASYGYNGFTDNLTTLLPEDDAATANWGSDWRMPTKEEWQELYNNTTVTWTTQNGVNGRLFTASNGNSLFLPAAGYWYESSLYYAGSHGYYWSCSLDTGNPYGACYLDFSSGGCYVYYYFDRSGGQSVRAVRSSAQNNAPTGAINGLFTINANGDQVYFSQGNLQYIGSAATPYWKFADNQWDYFGTTTGQNSSNHYVDRDLFGWGTSGYNYGATAYQPWATSTSSDSYGISNYYNLNDQTGQADWGYNAISNGGNQENSGWRTLTTNEWYYVFNTRTGAALKKGHGNVNGVNGMILLPDAWTLPEGLTFTSGNSSWANVYTPNQWAQMENNGAIFLPATGIRNGTSLDDDVENFGLYWSSSGDYIFNAYSVYFGSGFLNPQYLINRGHGLSVRLVRPAQ